MDQKQAMKLAAHDTVLPLNVKRRVESPELMGTLRFTHPTISGSP
jgi:hypothetical protein